MKKALALILTLAMLVCAFAGCGKQTEQAPETSTAANTETAQPAEETEAVSAELEPVTLKWYYVGDEMEGSADVLKAFNDKLTEKFYDLLEEGIQKAVDAGALTLGDNSWYINTEIMPLAARGYVSLDASGMTGTLGNYFIDPESDSGEVLYLYDIPEVQMAAERMKKWADLGYFTQAQIAGQNQEGALEVLSANPQSTGSWQGADERGVKAGKGNDGNEKMILLLDLPEQNYVGPSSFAFATAQVIPYTSKNPERAMMLLNLLHDEPGTVGNDLMNLLCYGFEANSEEAAEYGWANYTAVEEDGQMYADPSIRNGADSKHTMTNWVMGNTYKIMHDGGSLTTAANKAYAMDFWENKYPTFKTCVVSNMQPSSLDVATELESVNVIYNEYKDQLKMVNMGLVLPRMIRI